MRVKTTLEVDSLRNWFDHPLSKLILKALADRAVHEQAKFLAMPLNAEPHTIERQLFRLSGKSELTRQLIEFDWIKDVLLEDTVEWRK